MERAMDERRGIVGNAIAEKIEAGFLGRGVRDVRPIGGSFPGRRQALLDASRVQAEELEDRPHPAGVAAGQVIVERQHVDAPAGQGVERRRENPGQRLALPRRQLDDAPAGQSQAGHHLNVERIEPQRPAGGFTDQGKDFDFRIGRERSGGVPAAHPFPDRSDPPADLGIGERGPIAPLDLFDPRGVIPKIGFDGISRRPAKEAERHDEDLLTRWIEGDRKRRSNERRGAEGRRAPGGAPGPGEESGGDGPDRAGADEKRDGQQQWPEEKREEDRQRNEGQGEEAPSGQDRAAKIGGHRHSVHDRTQMKKISSPAPKVNALFT